MPAAAVDYLPGKAELGDAYRDRARKLLNGQLLSFIFHPFLTWTAVQGSNNAGTGAHRFDTSDMMSATTLASAGDRGEFLLYANANGSASAVPIGVSGEWYIAANLTTNFAANAAVVAGITYVSGDGATFALGYNGAVSLNAWTFTANGVSISGGTYSNSPTRLEAVRAGGNTYLFVNGVLVAQSATAYPVAAALLCFGLSNNASAVARRINMDEYVVATPSGRQAFP